MGESKILKKVQLKIYLYTMFRKNNAIMANTKNASVFNAKPSILTVIGLVLTVIAIVLLAYHPYGHYRKWKLRLNKNDDCFNSWKSPASDIFMKIYIFNITNKDAFLEGREKLRVQEVGPYTWKQRMERVNATFHPENDTVTVNPTMKFEWIPSMSVGKEDDILILPNIAYLLFRSDMEQWPFYLRLLANTFFGSNISQPIVPQTVEEYLFGFDSEVIRMGKTWMPHRITYDKLGLVDRTYDLRGDVANIHAGHLKAGTFAAYNHHTTVPNWEAPCNKFDGSSDGVKFPAEIQPNQSLSFYTKNMCRAIPMVQVEDEISIHGFRSIRYKFHKDALTSGDKNEANKCFCRNDKCLPDGLIDITDCSAGFNVALSYPHFFDGDPALLENVDGLEPLPQHETYFDINPDTGTLFRCSVKIQTNAMIGDISNTEDCKAFSNTVLPLIWMDVLVEDSMSPKTIFNYTIFLKVLPWLDRVGPYILLLLGLGFIVYGWHCFRRISIDRQKSSASVKKNQYSGVATEEGRVSADDKMFKSSVANQH